MKSTTNKEHSELVKEGLRKARERGNVGGNPHIRDVQPLALEIVSKDADAHARALAPVIQELQAAGHTTLIALAAALNARGIQTARGGKWYPTTVKNLLKRLTR